MTQCSLCQVDTAGHHAANCPLYVEMATKECQPFDAELAVEFQDMGLQSDTEIAKEYKEENIRLRQERDELLKVIRVLVKHLWTGDPF